MIGKITQRTGFAGVIGYALDREESRLLETNGLREGSNETMARSFAIQARLNPIAKPVAHISLNFSAEDSSRISDKFMVQVAREYLEKMGYGNTQFMLARHLDKEHPHCHLVINRIDFDGKRISDKNEKRRNAKVCRELTEKYGLHISDGKKNVKREQLRSAERAKYEIHDSLMKHLPNCKSWEELERRLRGDGISIEFKHKGSTDTIEGVKFTKDDWSFSGSKVDKGFSYSKINYALDRNAYEESQRVAESQREQMQQQRELEQNRGDGFIGALGIFDLTMSGCDDPEEEAFRKQMQKKKKQQIKMKF
ncbi:MAG: relaxase/mobilization nuclease domain-containing protein [Rikenellaceae bacterium]